MSAEAPGGETVEDAVERAIIRLMASEPKAADIKVAVDYLRLKKETGPPQKVQGSGFDRGGLDDD